jgi:hypothetical protein
MMVVAHRRRHPGFRDARLRLRLEGVAQPSLELVVSHLLVVAQAPGQVAPGDRGLNQDTG